MDTDTLKAIAEILSEFEKRLSAVETRIINNSRAGQVTSPAKKISSALNGRRGGRPKKTTDYRTATKEEQAAERLRVKQAETHSI